MGFRNPLTSLSADAITPGEIAPGVTITGALVRSAAIGNRFELQQSAGIGTLKFFAGIAAETPGQIRATTAAGVAGDQTLSIIGGTNVVTLPAAGAPEIDLYCYQDQFATWQGAVAANVPLTAPNIAGGQFDAPYAQVSRTTPFAVGAAAWTAVPWSQQDEAGGITWALGNPTRLPVTVAGLYDLRVSVEWGGTGAFARYLAYRINGGAQVRVAMNAVANAEVNESVYVRLGAGQYLEVMVYTSSADSIVLSDGLPRAQLKWVRR